MIDKLDYIQISCIVVAVLAFYLIVFLINKAKR